MTPELFRVLEGLVAALMLFFLNDIRKTVRNHWTKIEGIDDKLDKLAQRVSKIEGWLDPKHGGGKL